MGNFRSIDKKPLEKIRFLFGTVVPMLAGCLLGVKRAYEAVFQTPRVREMRSPTRDSCKPSGSSPYIKPMPKASGHLRTNLSPIQMYRCKVRAFPAHRIYSSVHFKCIILFIIIYSCTDSYLKFKL